MKKITILVIAMVASFGALAQFNQGRMLVGGSASLRSTTGKTKDGGQTVTNGTRTDFNLSPRFGYFVIDNLAVGAELGIGLSKWNSKTNGSDYNTNTLSFGPFVRYYLPVNVFFHGNLNFGTQRTKYENSNFDTGKYNTFGLGIGAGYAWMLNDYIAVEPMLLYGFKRGKDSASDDKYIDSGLSLSVGFQIYLGNK